MCKAHSDTGIDTMSGAVLVFGAHPDDAVLGAGGFASSLVARGVRVVFVTATRGELGGEPRRREEEDRAAARILGVEFHSSPLPDTRIELRSAIELVEASLSQFKPLTVLVHDPRDSHQDHVCLSRAVVSACRRIPNVLFYEGPSTLSFSCEMQVEISRVWSQKHAALLAHGSQMFRNLLGWSDAASLFRAWPRYPGGRCEGFRPHHCDIWTLSTTFCAQSLSQTTALAEIRS